MSKINSVVAFEYQAAQEAVNLAVRLRAEADQARSDAYGAVDWTGHLAQWAAVDASRSLERAWTQARRAWAAAENRRQQSVVRLVVAERVAATAHAADPAGVEAARANARVRELVAVIDGQRRRVQALAHVDEAARAAYDAAYTAAYDGVWQGPAGAEARDAESWAYTAELAADVAERDAAEAARFLRAI